MPVHELGSALPQQQQGVPDGADGGTKSWRDRAGRATGEDGYQVRGAARHGLYVPAAARHVHYAHAREHMYGPPA